MYAYVSIILMCINILLLSFLILFFPLLLPPSPPFCANGFALSVPADDVSCDGLSLALLPISTGRSQIYSAFLQRTALMLRFGSAVKTCLKR